jgi:predicted DsbA family dithiol-disulfide isomerase
MSRITVTYFSDVLCVWAYVAQARIDAIKRTFPGEVRLDYRFCSVFGDTRVKIGEGWRDRDGFAGYGRHVAGVVQKFEHVALNPQAWTSVQPTSSVSPHLFLSAVLEWERTRLPAVAEPEPLIFESVMWALRRGFFQDGLDISQQHVQRELARPFGVDLSAVGQVIEDGSAFARLSSDYQSADRMRIEGSPTFVLNEGRQKLFGNVGFRVIEANIKEVLRDPNQDQASWC